jgi:hypothetical protein
MSGIAEAMSGMASGKRSGGISSRMEGHEPEHKAEHEHDGVHEHLKALHEKMAGKHMHIHQHEGGYTTHHISEDGKVDGPHEHQNTEELKNHLSKFFDEEEHESPHEEHDGELM